MKKSATTSFQLFVSHHHQEFTTTDTRSDTILQDFHFLWKQTHGDVPTLWLSERLQATERSEKIADADAFIIILTPAYKNDARCIEELNQIIHATKQTPERIFKVRKTQMSDSEEPELLRFLLDYDFFGLDYELQVFHDFTQGDDGYWERLDDLVQDLGEYLGVSSYKKKGAMYLALTTPDKATAYQELARDFKHHGYAVFPKFKPPKDRKAYEQFVLKSLYESQFSVHILGELFGESFEPQNESYAEVQLALAKEVAQQRPGFKRFIWLPNRANITESRQRKLIEYLQMQQSAQQAAEILQTDIETLKTIIYQYTRSNFTL